MTGKRKSWRDVLKVHPAAEMFPPMGEDELKALGEDIKKNGLRMPVALDADKQSLLDGRNRLDAMELVGLRVLNKDCSFLSDDIGYGSLRPKLDPYDYVLSVNAHRRHLTVEQKREIIAKMLKARPEKSNRQIAASLKVSHHTVGNVRTKEEARGQIAHIDKHDDTKGRKQPASKGRKQPASKPAPEITLAPATGKLTTPSPSVPAKAEQAQSEPEPSPLNVYDVESFVRRVVADDALQVLATALRDVLNTQALSELVAMLTPPADDMPDMPDFLQRTS